jgi:threonine dehydrogenase-like Zn-dependent dehydrogenase
VVGALQQSINHVRTNGTVVSLGFCTKPDGVMPAMSTFKQVTLIFSMAYSIDEFRFAVDAFDRGHVEPRLMVSNVISLDQVPETIEQMRAGTGTEIKVHARPDI